MLTSSAPIEDFDDLFAGLEPASEEAMPRGMEGLECGHTDWHPPTKNATAREAGFCCEEGRRKVPPSWRDLRGVFIRPLPVHVRRTHEKERMKGSPGYCCDDAGYYIGGIGNDCNHYRPEGTRPCKAHRSPEEEPPMEKVVHNGHAAP